MIVLQERIASIRQSMLIARALTQQAIITVLLGLKSRIGVLFDLQRLRLDRLGKQAGKPPWQQQQQA
jgi:hypothetical protein